MSQSHIEVKETVHSCLDVRAHAEGENAGSQIISRIHPQEARSVPSGDFEA